MSLVTWYKVEIAPAGPAAGGGGLLGAAVGGLIGGVVGAAVGGVGLSLPLVVSNDVFSGSFVLDAEITVVMTEGATADTFSVSIIDLPTRTTELIRAVHATTPLNVTVHMGYFDEPQTRVDSVSAVMLGRLMSVTSTIDGNGYARTVLYGQEEAGYKLRKKVATLDKPGITDAMSFVTDLVNAAGVNLADKSSVPGVLPTFTVRQRNTLDALRELARKKKVPLVVRDGTVFIGAAVGREKDDAPVTFDPDTNIVKLGQSNAEDSTPSPTADVRNTVHLTVLGHPRLRVGQNARITGLDGVPKNAMRLSRVVHEYNLANGYTAELTMIAAGAGVLAQVADGVQGLADRLQATVDRGHDDHPNVDVGEVTEYAAGAHTVALNYGQSPDADAVSPSVATPVDNDSQLHDRPIAAPFAFDQTGLVVPVYPGMRALLAHNLGLVNDAVVAGFLWGDDPQLRHPPNEERDYWLALPTGLDNNGVPTGPGANDLIDRGGHRVIQTTGLHIMVGPDIATTVGTRPTPPDDASITIEHQSGSVITIDADGGVQIRTNNQTITMTNGSVSLTLDGSTVAVS